MPVARTQADLKANRKRTVRMEAWEEDGRPRGIVIKHFHDPHLIGLVLDRLRASGEHRILSALTERGVRVPRPLALRRVGRGWQVEMEWLPDTISLSDVLGDASASTIDQRRLAGRLGRLLAQLHAAGLDHTDLHASNVLIDPSGEPWMIDFHQARLRRRLGSEAILRQMVSIAARGREYTSWRFRARVFLAWLAGLPADLRALLPARDELLRRIEDGARDVRRAFAQRTRRRWIEPGPTSHVVSIGVARLLAPAELGAPALADLRQQVEMLAKPAAPGVSTELVVELDGTARRLLVLGGESESEVVARHARVGGLTLLSLPLPAPWVLCRGPHAWSAFLVPPAPARSDDDTTPARRDALALGRLVGTFHDRGLQPLEVQAHALRIDEGRRLFAPGGRCEPFDPRPGRSRPEQRFAGIDVPSVEREAFLDAYLAAFRHSAEETRCLERELR